MVYLEIAKQLGKATRKARRKKKEKKEIDIKTKLEFKRQVSISI